MDPEHLSILNNKLMNTDPDIFLEQAHIIILDIKSLVCMANNGKVCSIPCSFDTVRGRSLAFNHRTADVQLMSDRPSTP